eukprot:CAMPEP_0113315526 /NCGR_PEP_ID=MMETSP0010_2-20120614/11162_1 /TAXON_ID=216773 ORGANISM="Corethron hystrix, Strain 308" /NCGR_SAMPLE_ID=MMETSP0010_2 /ASSEMBLY_ACC=CAM_ASM_000155 /LENGTH=602 /DNA_ID=CAMNT_0000172051 /DNA_START=237 /DNA_END=2045 /DNA_ORIENTATION=+ /assembly_acc=CAM_ASM_000155
MTAVPIQAVTVTIRNKPISSVDNSKVRSHRSLKAEKDDEKVFLDSYDKEPKSARKKIAQSTTKQFDPSSVVSVPARPAKMPRSGKAAEVESEELSGKTKTTLSQTEAVVMSNPNSAETPENKTSKEQENGGAKTHKPSKAKATYVSTKATPIYSKKSGKYSDSSGTPTSILITANPSIDTKKSKKSAKSTKSNIVPKSSKTTNRNDVPIESQSKSEKGKKSKKVKCVIPNTDTDKQKASKMKSKSACYHAKSGSTLPLNSVGGKNETPVQNGNKAHETLVQNGNKAQVQNPSTLDTLSSNTRSKTKVLVFLQVQFNSNALLLDKISKISSKTVDILKPNFEYTEVDCSNVDNVSCSGKVTCSILQCALTTSPKIGVNKEPQSFVKEAAEDSSYVGDHGVEGVEKVVYIGTTKQELEEYLEKKGPTIAANQAEVTNMSSNWLWPVLLCALLLLFLLSFLTYRRRKKLHDELYNNEDHKSLRGEYFSKDIDTTHQDSILDDITMSTTPEKDYSSQDLVSSPMIVDGDNYNVEVDSDHIGDRGENNGYAAADPRNLGNSHSSVDVHKCTSSTCDICHVFKGVKFIKGNSLTPSNLSDKSQDTFEL